MKRLKIKQQNFIILGIIDALKTNVQGKGIRELHDIEIERGHYDSCIQFSRKDGNHIKPIDFFMLGYLVGSEYQK